MKIIQLALISTLILFSINAIAQNDFKVGISMGTVLPLNEFAETDMSNYNSGFSESGFTLNFDGDYYIHNRFALSARLHFGLSSMNEEKVYDWLKDEMVDYFIDDTLTTTNIEYWQWSSPMLGIKYNYPIVVNKLYFETGIFSGINISPIPSQSITIIDDDNERRYYSDNEPGTYVSLPVMIDGGLRLVLNENIQLKLISSYYQATIKYKHKNSFQNIDTAVIDINEFKVTTPIKNLNISLGLIYNL